MANTYTKTFTYTKARLSVIDDQFELFFRCAGMSDTEVKKMLKAIEEHKLDAVGVYIEDGGYKIAEVSLSIDWDLHNKIVFETGSTMNTKIAGWKDGVAPEAYVPVQNLAEMAQEMGKELCSWIHVSANFQNNKEKFKAVCDELGYNYNSSAPSFKEEPVEKKRSVNKLEELTVTKKVVKGY